MLLTHAHARCNQRLLAVTAVAADLMFGCSLLLPHGCSLCPLRTNACWLLAVGDWLAAAGCCWLLFGCALLRLVALNCVQVRLATFGRAQARLVARGCALMRFVLIDCVLLHGVARGCVRVRFGLRTAAHCHVRLRWPRPVAIDYAR